MTSKRADALKPQDIIKLGGEGPTTLNLIIQIRGRLIVYAQMNGPDIGIRSFRANPDDEFDVVNLIDATKVEEFAKALEHGVDDNVGETLNAVMCCIGIDCDCRGSSIGDYLAWQLREAIK